MSQFQQLQVHVGLTLHVKTNIPSQIKLLSYTKESVITFELQLVLNVTAD